MPGFNPDKINIYELTIEEPEKESGAPFNAERDITQEQWEKINEYFGNYRPESMNKKIFTRMARDLSILNHMPMFSGSDLDTIESATRDLYSPEDRAMSAILLGHKQDVSYPVSEIMRVDYDQLNAGQRGRMAKDIIIMGRPDIIPSVSRQMHEDLKEIRENIFKHYFSPELTYLRETVVAIKLLGEDPKLSSEEWRLLKEQLQKFLSDGVYDVALSSAADLAILAADEVKIPEGGGLELISKKHPKLEKSEMPQIPEQRSF